MKLGLKTLLRTEAWDSSMALLSILAEHCLEFFWVLYLIQWQLALFVRHAPCSLPSEPYRPSVFHQTEHKDHWYQSYSLT